MMTHIINHNYSYSAGGHGYSIAETELPGLQLFGAIASDSRSMRAAYEVRASMAMAVLLLSIIAVTWLITSNIT